MCRVIGFMLGRVRLGHDSIVKFRKVFLEKGNTLRKRKSRTVRDLEHVVSSDYHVSRTVMPGGPTRSYFPTHSEHALAVPLRDWCEDSLTWPAWTSQGY